MKVDKERLPIARRENVEQGTMIYGFNDKRYSLPTFDEIYTVGGWVYGRLYGKEGTKQLAKEWSLGDSDSRYQFYKQEYGQVIFKLKES